VPPAISRPVLVQTIGTVAPPAVQRPDQAIFAALLDRLPRLVT
jgi:hypothetical protein